jgi:hypothetical protein
MLGRTIAFYPGEKKAGGSLPHLVNGLLDSRDRWAQEGEEIRIVKAYKSYVLPYFEAQDLQSLNNVDCAQVIGYEQCIRTVPGSEKRPQRGQHVLVGS